MMRLLVISTALVLALGAAMQQLVRGFPRKPASPGKSSKPILAMELARNAADVKSILGPADQPGDARRRGMARAQYLDFLFIAAYVCQFAVAARVNAGEGGWTSLAIAAAALIAAAGVADLFEDVAILRAIAAPSDVPGIRPWALWKWGLFAAAVVAQGAVLALSRRPDEAVLWTRLAGAGVIAAGIWCLWSILTEQTDATIERTTGACVLAMLPVVFFAFLGLPAGGA
jgi:hypothetical protein